MPFNNSMATNLTAGTLKSAKIDSLVHHLVNSMVVATGADIVVVVTAEDMDSGVVMDEVDMVDLVAVDTAAAAAAVVVVVEEEEEEEEEHTVMVDMGEAMPPFLLTTLLILHPRAEILLIVFSSRMCVFLYL
jgi:hypothetical protein